MKILISLIVILFFLEGCSFLAQNPNEIKRKEWKNYLESLISNNSHLEIFNQAKDAKDFCENYETLIPQKKSELWAELFLKMAEYESSLNPTNTMKENIGIDPVTKKQVMSEGLLQLSYQDTLNHPEIKNCGIDWDKDKLLEQNDLHKSIFDPKINLYCGLLIMEEQIKRYSQITLKDHVYWSTLKIDGTHSKIFEIQRYTNDLPICRQNKEN